MKLPCSATDVPPGPAGKTGWPWEATAHVGVAMAIELPKISIVIPSYNQGQYLEETIRSIILQAYASYEIIIIDAGSNDSTLEIIRRYEKYIAYWVSEPDRGQSHAIEKGLARVTGDIANWINSDDLLAPGALHAIAGEFAMSKCEVLCGRCDYFTEELGNWDVKGMRMGLGETVGETIAAAKITQPSTFFKASVLKDLGVDEQYHYTMDLELWNRYLLQHGQHNIFLSEATLAYFRLHNQSKTVALQEKFVGDARKSLYNIFYALKLPPSFLEYIAYPIPAGSFKPAAYSIAIPTSALRPLIRVYAWYAVQFYNEKHNSAACKECLKLALKNGQPLTVMVLRQFIKHLVLAKLYTKAAIQ